MHAPYAAQYCVIGGSGAGSGGSFTPDAAAVCAAPAAAVSEAPLSALVADAGVAAAVVAVAVVELAVFVAAAVVAVLTPAPLAPGAVAAAGMLAPGGVAEKLLWGKGGRDGAPVDDVLVAAGLRGGSCDSCAMLIFVCLLAVA